jgi:hypothetical protein
MVVRAALAFAASAAVLAVVLAIFADQRTTTAPGVG